MDLGSRISLRRPQCFAKEPACSHDTPPHSVTAIGGGTVPTREPAHPGIRDTNCINQYRLVSDGVAPDSAVISYM